MNTPRVKFYDSEQADNVYGNKNYWGTWGQPIPRSYLSIICFTIQNQET